MVEHVEYVSRFSEEPSLNRWLQVFLLFCFFCCCFLDIYIRTLWSTLARQSGHVARDCWQEEQEQRWPQGKKMMSHWKKKENQNIFIFHLLRLKIWEAPPSARGRRRTQRTGKSQRERRARCPRGRWRPPPPHHHSWPCHPPRGRLPRPSLNLRFVSLYKLWATKQNYFLDRSNFSSNCWPLRLAFWSVLLPFKLWGSLTLTKWSLLELDPGPERAKNNSDERPTCEAAPF